MADDELADRVETIEHHIAELSEAIDELDNRVRTLEDREASSLDGLDQYDAFVIDEMEDGRSYSKRQMKDLYMRAGIRDTKKVKSRVRHLRKRGVLENDGRQLRLADKSISDN